MHEKMDPMTTLAAVPDPRVFPDIAAAPAACAELFALADASLTAETGERSATIDRRVRDALVQRLAGDGRLLARLFAATPSVAVTRHLWRQLELACRDVAAAADGIALTVFAIPLVIVAGLDGATGEAVVPGVIDDAVKIVDLLREHGALGGNRTFGIANALVGVDAIDLPRLPDLLAWHRLPERSPDGVSPPERALAPLPLAIAAGREAVYLRFLVGTALAKPGADLLAGGVVGGWGAPMTHELARQLGHGGIRVLALPRAPQRLLPAVAQGRAAQREVSAQLFASNAIRRIRASVGEPSALISAHRAPDAVGGGELRLSLSSPFEPRDAEGFRCPLYPLDRVGDAVAMLVDLLADCRVTDVRLIGGVHPDRDAATGLPLLFKSDTIPAGARALH
ncbi:MAG: hypothetical protein GZ089_05670 [Aromatoleum sp.]|nr:hypothetical protein [Aromatoleum sp.]